MSGFFAAGRHWDLTGDALSSFQSAIAQLADAGLPDARTEAQHLWVLADGQVHAFNVLVERRAAREPLSHLRGYRDFYKHRFAVTPDVLDPRPDTEELVRAALETPFATVLDLGTGSGCILLSLLADRPAAVGVGTDLSPDALAVAAQNAAALDVAPRATLRHSDWYEAVTERFDLIVSNPPYIAASEMAGLQPEVRDHEPRMALTDEADGLACYRAIIAGAPKHLTPGGWLMLEIGLTQAQAVRALMAAKGFDAITTRQDLNGHDRVVLGQLSLE